MNNCALTQSGALLILSLNECDTPLPENSSFKLSIEGEARIDGIEEGTANLKSEGYLKSQ